MEKIFNFIYDHFLGILSFIFFTALIVFFSIANYQISKTDLFDLEERCFNFYKENNYILEECNKYVNKLKGE